MPSTAILDTQYCNNKCSNLPFEIYQKLTPVIEVMEVLCLRVGDSLICYYNFKASTLKERRHS